MTYPTAIPGALGSVVALGGNAIDIATAGVKVPLRNLVIVPFPGGGGPDSTDIGIGVRRHQDISGGAGVVGDRPAGDWS